MSTCRPALAVEAIGTRVGIEADEVGLTARLLEAWAACLIPEVGAMDVSVSATDLNTDDGDVILERISQRVTMAAIEARAGELLMLHACAVAEPTTGRSVILAGPSGMGKTTLAAALGQQWAYVTDETAGVTEDLRLLPYPKPLSVIVDSARAKQQVAPANAGLQPWRRESCPVGVVLLDRRPGVAVPVVTRVRTVPAIAILAEHTSYFARLNRPLHRMGALLNATGGLRRVSYTRTEQMHEVVANLMDSA